MLHWGRFNNDGVGSIILYKLHFYSIYFNLETNHPTSARARTHTHTHTQINFRALNSSTITTHCHNQHHHQHIHQISPLAKHQQGWSNSFFNVHSNCGLELNLFLISQEYLSRCSLIDLKGRLLKGPRLKFLVLHISVIKCKFRSY